MGLGCRGILDAVVAAALPFVVRFPAAGFLPFVGARPLVLAPLVLEPSLAGGNVALAAAVPSVAVDVFFGRLSAAGVGAGLALLLLGRADLALRGRPV